jgi:hypothetical protein
LTQKVTDEQILAALHGCNGIRTLAAQAVGISLRPFMGRLAKLKAAGHDIPRSGYDQATSTLYGPDGTVKLQWIKRPAQELTAEGIADAIRNALLDVPNAKAIPAPKSTLADLLTVYPIGDAHLGMYAWAEEAGEDYDLKIAERLHTSAMAHLVAKSDATAEALIVDVGDFTHYDNIRGETARSHNTLDIDTRYHAMIRCTLRLLCTCINKALEKHKRVTVVAVPGNHNDMGAAWMVESLAMHYRANLRVRQGAARYDARRHRQAGEDRRGYGG